MSYRLNHGLYSLVRLNEAKARNDRAGPVDTKLRSKSVTGCTG
jgi:hypothetical protein